VAMVTPHLVKPMTQGKARLPTDKYIEPSDVDVYLLGLDQGRQKPPVKTAPAAAPLPDLPALPPGFGRQSVN